MRTLMQTRDNRPPQGLRTNDLCSATAESLPIRICLLGNFVLLKEGQAVRVGSRGKVEVLLCMLALQTDYRVSRDSLLSTLWPNKAIAQGIQSLNSLVYSLHRLLGDAIGGATPVLHADGHYRINVEAGIGVDVACFDALANAGDRRADLGNRDAAAAAFEDALHQYRGELCADADAQAVIERERLRARYLTLLAWLADYHYSLGDYTACLDYAHRLLDSDPGREDAHRLIMRCYVRRGERAQALRQYRLCQEILYTAFEAVPEPATTALFHQLRLDPSGI